MGATGWDNMDPNSTTIHFRWNFRTERVHGRYIVSFSEGPQQLAIHDNMLSGQCGDGVGHQFTCMGAMGQDGMGPNWFVSIESPPNEKAISDIGQGWLAG